MKGNYHHGGRKSRLYDIWRHMKSRCYNPNDQKYHRYGQRGITVCLEWLEFPKFREWAESNGYRDDLTIDRIDNDGNYEPGNCRWATAEQQANNRATRVDARLITWNGETHSLMEWSKITGIKYKTLSERYRRGWNVPRLFEEVKSYGNAT